MARYTLGGNMNFITEALGFLIALAAAGGIVGVIAYFAVMTFKFLA